MVWESLTKSWEAKGKGEKERYTNLKAEFQRIVRREKKAFFSDQCKEIWGKNRMGKTRDLFKKIKAIKGIFHAKLGTIKDRNGMDLIVLSREGRDSGLHSRLPLGVRPRLEGKQRTPLSSRVSTLISWCPLSGLKEFQLPLHFWERTRDCSPGQAGKEDPHLARTGASQGFPRAAAPVGVFSEARRGSQGASRAAPRSHIQLQFSILLCHTPVETAYVFTHLYLFQAISFSIA